MLSTHVRRRQRRATCDADRSKREGERIWLTFRQIRVALGLAAARPAAGRRRSNPSNPIIRGNTTRAGRLEGVETALQPRVDGSAAGRARSKTQPSIDLVE